MRRAIERSVCAGLITAALTLLALGAVHATREAAANGWKQLGYDWLTLDLIARSQPWTPALAVGLSALAIVLALEGLSARLSTQRSRFLAALLRPVAAVARPWPALTVAVLAAGLPQLLAVVARPTPAPDSPNVLFVLIDTWRADHAGFLGYERAVSPKLDALATRGVVFERAIASSGWTKPSVATLFTGLMPSEHRAISQPVRGLRVRGIQLPREVTTFVETLAAHGWETGMWSNNPNILPDRGFAQGARYFADYFHRRRPGFDAGRSEHMLPDVQRWIAAQDEARPFCAYVHIMDPHFPYVAPAPFAGTFDRSNSSFQLTGPVVDDFMSGARSVDEVTDEMRQHIIDIYDEELLYVDHYVGRFLERMLAEHPNTIILVASDHGEEFLEHGQFGHGHSLYEELVHVPLVLWGPQLEAGHVRSQVRLMDVFPTLLELVGLGDAVPPGVQGRSLMPLIAGAETGHRPAPMETGGDERPAWQWRALSDGRLKWIRREVDLPTVRPIMPLSARDDGARPYELLFDLTRDPGETRDLLPRRGEEATRLFELMRARDWWHSPTDVLQLQATEAGVEGDVDALRDLGYAGADE